MVRSQGKQIRTFRIFRQCDSANTWHSLGRIRYASDFNPTLAVLLDINGAVYIGFPGLLELISYVFMWTRQHMDIIDYGVTVIYVFPQTHFPNDMCISSKFTPA